MFVPTPTWPTYLNSSIMFDSRSSSTVDSWESSSSSQGGSTPPPYLTSAWPGPTTRQQIGTSSQGSVWDNNDYYDDIFGREMETTNILEEDGSNTHVQGFEAKLQDNKPDLLDSLVMEDQMEKAKCRELKQLGAYSYQASSLEITNLLKLLHLQQTITVSAPEGRAITRDQRVMNNNMNHRDRVPFSCYPSSGTVMSINHSLVAQMKKQSAAGIHLYSPSVLPSKFKAPPPHHPPAVPLVINNSAQSRAISPAAPQPGSAAAVHLRVQEAKWQFQRLEVERKKTEAALAKQNPGKRISSSNSVQIPRLPLNPSQLDKLLVDSLREQARVLTLLQRVETIKENLQTQDDLNALTMWKQKILIVTTIRRKERMNQKENGELLGDALAKMCLASRKTRCVFKEFVSLEPVSHNLCVFISRTVLWSMMMMMKGKN